MGKYFPNPDQIGPMNEIENLLVSALEYERSGDTLKAESSLLQILSVDQRHTHALHKLGLLAFQQGKFALAIDFLNRAIDTAPGNPSLFYDRGVVFQAQGEYGVAIKNYDLALFLEPGNARVYSNRGTALEALGEAYLAIDNFVRAICYDPTFENAWYNMGNSLKTLEKYSQAVWCYERAVSLNPLFWQSYTNQGLCLFALKQKTLLPKAVFCYEQAISCAPNVHIIYYNLANSLRACGLLEMATINYTKSLQIEPLFAQAYANRGLISKDLNLLEAAKEDYKKAISIEPELLEAKWNLAIVHLMQGELLLGWADYELRFMHEELKSSVGVKKFNALLWNGVEDLNGKTILIYTEQGIGDAIQFARYLPLLSKRGANILVQTSSALLEIFTTFSCVSKVFLHEHDPPMTGIDFYSPLLSLPRAFATTLRNLPAPLRPIIKEQYFDKWRKRVGSLFKLKVKARIGIVWSGNPLHTNDHNRSIALIKLLEYLPLGVQYITLQKQISAEDKITLQAYSNIENISQELVTLSDTAALCTMLDLIVSVDTSVAHLSATLDCPTALLIPFSPDWRWLTKRNDSPWYPSVQLFRQHQYGVWDAALEALRSYIIKTFFKDS